MDGSVNASPGMLAFLAELKEAVPESVSGAAVSRRFGVSRTAVWKWANALRDLGYNIHSSARGGYSLIGVADRLYPWEIADGLRSRRFAHSVHHYSVTSSTQDKVRHLAEEGAVEGTVVVAEEQRTPRGRLRRAYFTPPGGLWFSLLLRPERAPKEVAFLSLLAAVGVHRAIEDVLGLQPTVKWPNDLLIGGRKVVGVLVEMMSEQDLVRYAVLGIGVNVNLRRMDFPLGFRATATSLREEVGRTVARLPLFQRIMERMEEIYDNYLRLGPREVLVAWRALPSILGQQVEIEDGKERWKGTAVDLADDGALLVRTNGDLRRIVAGDVRLVTFAQRGEESK